MASDLKQKRITVVFVERVPWAGGAERVVFDIARNLDSKRFKPIIVCLYKGKLPPTAMAQGLSFVELVPETLSSLLKATLKGRLGDEFAREWRRWFSTWWHCLKVNLRLRVRLRNFKNALRAGMAIPFVKSKLYKLLGMPCTDNALLFEIMKQRVECAGMSEPLVYRILRLSYSVGSNVFRILVSNMARACGKNMQDPELTKLAPQFFDVPYRHRRPIDIERQARLLASFVGNLRGPVVVVPVMEEAAAAVCLGLGARPYAARPYIVQTHAWESYYLPVMYGGPGFDVEEECVLFSNACRGAEVVTSPSVGCRDDLIENFGSPSETTICLPNPVDLDAIRRLAEADPEIPLPEICAGKAIFLCVARLDPQKNHKLLFEACALLKKRREDFVLICLGEGFFRQALEERIVSLGLEKFIHLLGYTQNPFPYMRLAKAHVTASESESFGLALVEALACGCLPISTDCPHGPRDVLDGDRSGFLVPNGSAQKLAEAMYQALADEDLVRKKLLYGQDNIERYSISSIIPRWEILFAHCAAKYGTLY